MCGYLLYGRKAKELIQCFQIVVLEKTLESPLDSKEIKAVNPKGNQPWKFIGRTDAEVSIVWPPDVKRWLTGKDPDAGKDWRQKEKRTAEDELVGWHHWLDGHRSDVPQSCPTLCDPMDCSPPGFSIHGIFQAWVLEWVAISFSRGSSWPRDWTQVSRIAGRGFTIWATRVSPDNLLKENEFRLIYHKIFFFIHSGWLLRDQYFSFWVLIC